MTKEQQLYEQWLVHATEDAQAHQELESIRGNDEEIYDRFYRTLSFGTAGLRGVLGLGTNRMNIYTVRQATQGLADVLLEQTPSPSVAIAYDSRHKSALFARETARVLAANGIQVHLFAELMPTPALSYAVRELHCDAGVVITASHNPAKYNGYKAYGSDGSQLNPQAADRVLEHISATDLFDGPRLCNFDAAQRDGRIAYIPEAFVQQYIDRVFAEALQPEVCAKAGLKLVYTPLNGAGNRCVRTILAKAGIQNIQVVKEQELPDGNFPTCPYPNPEMAEALALGLELCRKTKADMLLATDPDSDRTAIAVRHEGEYRQLTGNEVGILLLDYICKTRKANGTLPEHPVTVKSLVSSPLADMVAQEYGVEMITVFTGFRFIGEAMLKLERAGEADRFVFGFEESCGYLSGSYARDKDAVNASLLLVEMASAYRLEGRTLIDALEDIHRRHGIYRNVVESFAFEGAQGMSHMADIMDDLRRNPPKELGGDPVQVIEDYQASFREENGVRTPLTMPSSNVLKYGLANGCTVIIRPSGTEPKIKLYYSVVGDSTQQVDSRLETYRRVCTARVQ